MNDLLCLAHWSPHSSCVDIDFTRSPFWVLHNLPLENMNVANANALLSKVGLVIEVENPIVDGKILRNFIRGRVNIDLDKPLSVGCWVPRRGLPNIWAVYKYERLQSLCFNCGIIGHDQKHCSKPMAMSPFNPGKPKYGPGFSVGAPRSIHYLGKDQVKKEPSTKHQNEPANAEEEERLRN